MRITIQFKEDVSKFMTIIEQRALSKHIIGHISETGLIIEYENIEVNDAIILVRLLSSRPEFKSLRVSL